ncbi:hypothetical protein AZE42_12159 [Rhizopogon vesiculosus]|uniref:Adenosine deaminase domain-containing protein n=1 Tax=Rhizopogon vesiculosus TaxID=180088 RepID=A0A1J8QGJ3_9AGAM|nr:hypothetical protein AZE42_12159 [Rhizopogon vesiculosus]
MFVHPQRPIWNDTSTCKDAQRRASADLTINGTTLLALALQHPSIHIRASQQITPASIKSVDIEFRPLLPSFVHRCISLCLPTYKPDEWVPLRRAREQFDATLGDTQDFDRWIASCLTINPSDAYVTHMIILGYGTNSVSLGCSQGLVYFTPVWRVFIRQFLEETIADRVSYVEARINFSPEFMIGPDGKANAPHKEWLRTFQDVLAEFRGSLQAQGRDGEFIGAEHHQLRYYEGFDLVGDENVLRPLKDYLPQLLSFSTLQASRGLPEHQRIPFIFHAGETPGDRSMADENLYDAMLLGTKRIGHGFSLVKRPKLMAMCRERGMALEVFPISNEILVYWLPFHVILSG